VEPESQAAVAPAFERRMARELDGLLSVVPHEELAVQWDACLEIFVWEGLKELDGVADPRQEVLDSLVRIGNLVPKGVELGYHLCYGDFRHKHGVEPKDVANMVRIANAIAGGLTRPFNWIHMPVPRDRDDDAYFAPLADLSLAPQTELYLGLVHYTDGEVGTRRRMAAASRHVEHYGIATECGLGRRDPTTIPELMRIHACCAA
jgi:methionine synthase II (cobalamin-independent)